MQTSIEPELLDTAAGREADSILRNCVHCGFCTATCPTYQLTGNELDGPRGRIYLIKQLLEGQAVSALTRHHLDRCLTCRSCETTCPSGVRYARLLEIGRNLLEQRLPRPPHQRLLRWLLRRVIPRRRYFGWLLRSGRLLRPLLPGHLSRKIPAAAAKVTMPSSDHPRTMLLLEACAQSSVSPNTNAALARLLDRQGIRLVQVDKQRCCGALSAHMTVEDESLELARENIDAWWPFVEQGAEAILVSASGCGTQVKAYGEMLSDDPGYSERAELISALARDPVEVLDAAALRALGVDGSGLRVAFQAPCSLQHGQQLAGQVETLLEALGFELTPVTEAHLCCGSAGSYSLLQPELSGRLLHDKLQQLEAGSPEVIATANIGCQMHLATATRRPVRHWVELVEESIPQQ